MKQKSSFRRFVCLLLTLAMLLSLGTTALAASPALLLHYDFAGDEGAAVSDKAGSYDGTLTVSGSGEAKLVSGANRDGGQAAEFVRGSAGQQGGYLEMPAKAFADAGSELTLNLWVKLDDLPNWTQLLSIGTDSNHYFVLAALGNPCGKDVGLTVAMKNNGAEQRIAASQGVTVPAGAWAMVTYVQSASSAALYVNGQKLNTAFYDASMNPADGSAYLKMSVAEIAGLEGAKAQLGRSICFTDNNFDGMVGDVQLYRGALSDEAISKLMSSGAENSKQVLHYDFVGDTGTTATDKAGSYNGTLTVSGSGEAKLVSGANRDGGQAAEFVRGSAGQQGGYLEMPAKAFADAGSELTLNLWVKLDDLPNWTQLLSIGTDSNHYFVLAALGNPCGKDVGLTVAMKNNGAEQRIAASQGVTVPAGAWAMVTYVQSASSAALYVNGQKLNTAFYDASMNPADGSAYLKMSVAEIAGLEGAKAQLGRSICFTDNNFDGMVGDVQLYRGALSDEAISKLMSSGAENSKQVLHYDFSGDEGTTARDKAGSYDGTLKTANDGEAKFDAAANIGGGQAAGARARLEQAEWRLC